MKTKNIATFFAILAAALYAINIPISKVLLQVVQPTMMAAFLYLGAGFGLLVYGVVTKESGDKLTRAELPYTVGMIVLDIAAPILLMLGLRYTNAANASLLNNFEIVATSVIAFAVFREVLSKRLTLAILLVTAASIALSFEGEGSFRFNVGSLLVLGAACCWGLENNCTRMLSGKSSVQITTVKGIFSGLGSLIVALIAGEEFPAWGWIGAVLVLGFVAYGLSINFYIKAQKELGAAKTSAYYSISPFLGVLFGMVLLGERPGIQFYIGLAIMIAATVLMVRDTIAVQHTHLHRHTHTHEHVHGDLWHTHAHTHLHSHTHVHGQEATTHGHDHASIENHDHPHKKVAFICVHNSCRSQIAEALGRKLACDVFESYSAGTETKPQINQDAVRLMKQVHGIDMEQSQYSKLLAEIPEVDVVITMGCNVQCPYLPCQRREDWGLEDPTGKGDEAFLEVIRCIEEKVLALKESLS